MTCEHCHAEDATIHLTQVVDGNSSKMHLCQKCAAELGVDFDSPGSLAYDVLGLGGESAPEPHPKTEKRRARKCPHCKTTLAQFKKTGRLGCSSCYDVFHEELEPFVQAMHHNSRHKGKVAAGVNPETVNRHKLEQLQEQLSEAIQSEAFERAAELRDAIRNLEDSGSADS